VKAILYILTSLLLLTNTYSQSIWTVYHSSSTGICSDTVTGIYIDNNGTYWFGTVRGVSKLNGNAWTSYTKSNSIFTEGSNIHAIIQFMGKYYFGGMGFPNTVLSKFDGKNWSTISGLTSNYISSMDTDNVGDLWIGTFDMGVFKYDGTNVVNYNTSNSLLPSDQVYDVKKDRNGNIWIAMADEFSYKGGIAKFDGSNWQIFTTQNSKLTNNNVHSITEDKKGNIWFGADSLILYKFDGTNWYRYDLSNQITSNWISKLAVDSTGNIWAGLGYNAGERGLIKFDGTNITRYDQAEGFPSNRDVTSIKVDKNNNLWIGSWDGLIKLNNAPKFNIDSLGVGDSLRSLSSINIQWGNQFQTNVKIEYSIDNGTNWILVEDSIPAQYQNYSWTVPVVAPASNQCKIRVSDDNNPGNFIESQSSFTIYAKVKTPVIAPNGGEKNNGINVSISCATTSAEIYYTTDGNEPDQNSKKYTAPFYANKSYILKAKAFLNNWVESDLATTNYQMKVATINFNPQPGTYSSPQQVSLSTLTDSASIHYTLDGSTPDKNSAIYSQPISVTINKTIKAIAYRNNFDSSSVAVGNYFLSAPVITPVIKTDSIWMDTDYNGYEERTVDGSGSSITYDSIYSYIWTVNGDSAASGAKVNLKLKTGTNAVTLTLTNPKAGNVRTTLYINVYASKMKTNGGIYSAVAQLDNNTFFVTSADDKIYQFDSTNTVGWNLLTGGKIQSTTCISDQNNIYVGSTDTRLYCFDQNGVPKWDKAMGGIITSSPSAGINGVVYVGISTGRLYALDGTGQILWNLQSGGAIVSSPSVSLDGDVYVGSCDKNLYSVSKDGNLNWTFTTGDSIFSSPAIGNDSSVIFGSNDGYIYKLDPNGNKMWSYYAGGKIKSSPIIINDGEIIAGSSNDKIICLSKDGKNLWSYSTSAPVNGTAAISNDGQILIGNDSGTLYSLDNQGNLLWLFKTNFPIESPVLITDNGLAIFGNLNGDIYNLKLSNNALKKTAGTNYEWPTFKGDNKRTGNKSLAITDIKDNKISEVKEFKLLQNYPNPFNPSTTINYSVPKTSFVTLKVYDVLGREVETLVNGEKSQGNYKIEFNASRLASGMYIYRMQAGSFVESKKLILMK